MTPRRRSAAAATAGAMKGRRARRVMLSLLALVALFLLPPAPARGQESGGTGGSVPADATADPADDGFTAPPAAPAGEPFVAPRSGRAYGHVFLAFGIAWALMLGFVLVLGRRFTAVERDLSRLRPGDE